MNRLTRSVRGESASSPLGVRVWQPHANSASGPGVGPQCCIEARRHCYRHAIAKPHRKTRGSVLSLLVLGGNKSWAVLYLSKLGRDDALGLQ